MRILVAAADNALREVLERQLWEARHEAVGVSDGLAAQRAIAQERWDLVLTELELPGAGGLEVLRALKATEPQAACAVMSDGESMEAAVEVMRSGAVDCLKWPPDAARLERLLAEVQARRERTGGRAVADEPWPADPLTGIATYQKLHQALDELLGDGGPSQTAVAVVDLDNFQLLNDTVGPPRCDELLRTVAGVTAAAVDPGDVVGRLSGDEFMIIMPGADVARAQATVERVQQRIGRIHFESPGGVALPITISAGIGECVPEDRDKMGILRDVDGSLRQAKREGGNAIRVSGRDALPSHAITGYSALEGLVEAIDARDRYTRLHSQQATRQAVRVAQAAGLGAQAIREIEITGPIHDLGKIVIPDTILRKPGPLSMKEAEEMRRHSSVGAVIAAAVPDLQAMVGIVRHHHERIDGRGYPAQLQGEEIPETVRAFSLGDAFSAMVSDRPYRKALPLDVALEQIERGAGSQFDPELAAAFLALDWNEHLALSA